MTGPSQYPSFSEPGRLADHVTSRLDVASRQREIIRKAIARLMEAPTAREIAVAYLAESIPTTVKFAGPTAGAASDFMLMQPRGYASWNDDGLVVTLNAMYLSVDESLRVADLPMTLGHELFGHGLWYARAARASVYQGCHHHELNEANARLVGWLISCELNSPVELDEAIRYLRDPAQYLAELKLKLPYYAMTFSSREMLRPLEVLEGRLRHAHSSRIALTERLAELHGRLSPPIDGDQRSDASDSRAQGPRGSIAVEEDWIRNSLANLFAVIEELDATIGRLNAESDKQSERYLRWASEHPFFAELQREVDKRTGQLQKLLRSHLPPELQARRPLD